LSFTLGDPLPLLIIMSRAAHILTVLSSPAEARVRQSGLKATERTDPVWIIPCVRISWPLSTFHSLAVLSSLPDEAKVWPSGLKAIDQIAPVGPASVRNSVALDASQSLTVLSSLPDAKMRPSGL
jgi:hypothetical protein